MAWFTAKADTPMEWRQIGERDLSPTMPPCGTAACIAGWANLFTKYFDESSSIHAQQVLGLDENEAESLFYDDNWPEPFRTRYQKAKTPKQRAKIACQRIDHLIKHGV